MTRQPDLAWESLVRVTNANPAAERGKLNSALVAIKEAWHHEGGLPEDLPAEIERRAGAYRKVWPTISLTPNALAVHWRRVAAESQPRKPPGFDAIDELLKGE